MVSEDAQLMSGRVEGGGYVYVIEFSNGTVKIGATANPVERLRSHETGGARFGIQILQHWISPLHDDHYRSEKRLISLAMKQGSVAAGREFFVGVDFASLVHEAASLPFPKVDLLAREDAAGRTVSAFHAFRQYASRAQAQPSDRFPETLRKAVASYFGCRAHLDSDSGEMSASPAYEVEIVPDQPISRELLAELADASAVPITTVADMDYINLLEMALLEVVRTEALNLRAYALQEGRDDLLQKLGRLAK